MKVGYKGSQGQVTFDPLGFKFEKKQSYYGYLGSSHYPSTLYGMYCNALGGWSDAYQNGSYSSPIYLTSGSYYNNMTTTWNINGTQLVNGTQKGVITSANFYTITTSPGTGGTMDGSGDYEEGTTVTVTAKPNAGYVCTLFNGVSYNDDSTGSKSTSFTVGADVTISASFTKYYNVRFYRNQSSSDNTTSTQTPLVYGKSYNLNTLAAMGWTRPGYRFLGWATSQSGAVAYTDGQSVKNLNTLANGWTSLYAVWQQCTLTYDANGGSSTPAAQSYYGDITLASAISKAGHAFSGWKIDSVTYNAGATYTLVANKTATAQWTAYTVSYNANGGSVSPSSASGVVTLPTPTKTGYTCTGWWTASSGGTKVGDAGASYSPTANITLYAQWTADAYTVTLNQQNGSGGTASVTATYDAAMPSATMPTRTGHIFGGYYDATGGSGTQYYNSDGTSARAWNKTSATTLYAKWTAKTYAVTLDGQSPTTAGTASVTATFGSAMPGITTLPQKTGYTFGGFYTAQNGGGTQYYNASGASAKNWEIDAATTLYAKWTPNTYTVKFNANGGSGTMGDQSFTYDAAQNLTANAFTRSGYTFGGWATSASGAKVYDNAQSASNLSSVSGATVNLYAKWIGNRCYIDFDLDGGGTRDPQTTYQDEVAEVAAPTRANYTFAGWTISGYGSSAKWGTTNNPTTAITGTMSATGAVYVLNLNTTNNSRVTMKALWTRIEKHPVLTNGSTHYSIVVSGGGRSWSVPAKTGADNPSATLNLLAGETYTITATMTAVQYTSALLAFPKTIGGYAMARTGTSDGKAVFTCTTGAIGDDYDNLAWGTVSQRVEVAIGANPLSETLTPTMSFADNTTTNIRVIAPETVGSDFLNWTAVTPSTALASGSNATDTNIVLRTSELTDNVSLTANWQLSRVNVSAQVHAASLAVIPGASGWVSVRNSSNTTCTDVGYGQSATWRITTTNIPSGYAFAGWYDAAGNLIGTSVSLTRTNVTTATTLYARFTSTLSVTWEEQMEGSPIDDLGYIVVKGVVVTAKPYSVSLLIGETVTIEAHPNSEVALSGGGTASAFFAGWFAGATHTNTERLALPATAEITIGANRSLCAFFRDTADIFYVAIYSRHADTGEYDALCTFSHGESEDVDDLTREQYYAATGVRPLDSGPTGGDANAAFMQVTGVQRLVVAVTPRGGS